MKTFLSLAHAKRLAAMSDHELADWLGKCTPRDLLMIDTAFELWAQQGIVHNVAPEKWQL